MIIQKERPTSGQWVVVWKYAGKSWSLVAKFHGGKAMTYSLENSCWEDEGFSFCSDVDEAYIQVK